MKSTFSRKMLIWSCGLIEPKTASLAKEASIDLKEAFSEIGLTVRDYSDVESEPNELPDRGKPIHSNFGFAGMKRKEKAVALWNMAARIAFTLIAKGQHESVSEIIEEAKNLWDFYYRGSAARRRFVAGWLIRGNSRRFVSCGC